jgi:sulfoxide reductase catalytic subunit YedY
MIIRRPPDIPSSEITPEDVYFNRRAFIKKAAAGVAAAALVPPALAAAPSALRRLGVDDPQQVQIPPRFKGMKSELGEPLNSYKDVTTYNNFYEFGTSKGDPAKNSGDFHPRPWSVEVAGEVGKPGTYHLEDFLKPYAMEDRVYRLRCVEAWSMVIPWRGVPLNKLIGRAEPTGNAKFVKFTTVYRPSEMPGQRTDVLDWPYVEGLRLDEAMHPLTLMTTGVYGLGLPNQNGAPLRLIVPWKYGFKGIKSIVKIELVESMPQTTWHRQWPQAYGFYANVNPHVDHPNWSQARERRLGELRKRPTLMFNGYGDQVAHLYQGMDLAKWY